jgi:hypothetical protein
MATSRRILLTVAAALAVLELIGVLLDAPRPWPWAGVGAAVALAGYAAVSAREASRLVRWPLVAAPVVVAVWAVFTMPFTGPGTASSYLVVGIFPSGQPAEPVSAVTASWQSLLRNAPLLLAVGCLVVALAAGTFRSGQGRPRAGLAAAVAVIGGAFGYGYAYLAIRQRVNVWPDHEGPAPIRQFAAAVLAEALLMLAAVAGAAIAAAYRGRTWYAVAGMALIAGYVAASVPGVLDRALLENLSQVRLSTAFLQPGLRYGVDSGAVPVGAVVRTAALLAGVGLAVVGIPTGPRPDPR